MRHVFAATACAFALVTLAACEDGAAGNNASAAAEGDLTSAFGAAADALQAKLGAPGEKTDLPPPNDPAVQAFETQSARALDALGTPRLPVDGFETFEAFCLKSANIIGTYVSAGAGAADPAAQQANVERYMDQMFTPLLFAAHCSAAHMPFLEETVKGEEVAEKQAALQQVRDGAFAQVAGLMQMAAADDIEAERRARILNLLEQDAGDFAVALSQQQRAQLVAMAGEMKAALPGDAAGKADAIAAAFKRPDCGTLCSM